LYQKLLGDARFFELLLRLDEDLARQAREGGCPCKGVLHSARYPRKPRGGPPSLGREHDMRASFCCAREGCRRRVTPPSLRFLGRKVFFAVVVVLVPILRDGPTPERLRRLEQRFGVSRRTLYRWREWWREVVPGSRWWRGEQGGWAEPVDRMGLPASLLGVLSGIAEPADRVLALLERLSSWPAGQWPTGQLEHAR
jgi:hypothetical protein